MHGLPDWNAIRYDSEHPRGHVESYFVKANDAEGRRALWLNAAILASNVRPAHAMAEAWAVVFDRRGQHVAVKESVPFAEASFSSHCLAVDVAQFLRFDSGGTHGGIDRGGHRIAWDLNWTRNGGALVHFPIAKMYTAAFPKSKLVSPYPDLRLQGTIQVDDEEIEVTGWKGMQGHSWGRGHANDDAWGHANQWDQDVDTVVEAASARMRVGPWLTPLLTMVCVRHEGREYRLTRPQDLMRNRGEVNPRRWFFGAKNGGIAVEGDFSAPTDDFVGLYYPNPDGEMNYRLNTKIAHARVRIELPGREPIDLTTRSAALELGTKDASHGVRMYV